jgi:hypothetical protein
MPQAKFARVHPERLDERALSYSPIGGGQTSAI